MAYKITDKCISCGACAAETRVVSFFLNNTTIPISTTTINTISTTPTPSSSIKKFLNPNIIFPPYT